MQFLPVMVQRMTWFRASLMVEMMEVNNAISRATKDH